LASKTFRCRVVTPTARILDEEVVSASIPAWDGSMGFLVDRAPILTRLGVGELTLEFPTQGAAAGGSRSYVIAGGFAQMVDNRLTILAETAIATETIAVTEAEGELRALENQPGPAADAKRNLARAKIAAARSASAAGI
jgi:F-type H+-transporting ATPase subunit epsilon